MNDNFLLNNKFSKATVMKVVNKYSKMGLNDIDKSDNKSKIEFKKIDENIETNDEPITPSDVKVPVISNKIIKHTKSLNSLQIKPSDIERSKKEDSVRKENRNNVLNINVIKNDKTAKSLAIMTRVTMGQIHNITTYNLQVVSNTVSQLNRFNNEVNSIFYNNTSSNLVTISNNLDKINNSLIKHVKQTTSSLNSNIFREKFQSLIYVENMFNLNELKEKIQEMIKSATLGMKFDMIKSFVKVGISSPISMLITSAVKRVIPKQIQDVFKSIDSIPSVVSSALGIQFKKMKDSDNPLIAWMGSKLLPPDERKNAPYKKGVVSFDTFTKMAITKNIPTLLINWLQAADPEGYKDGLAYDYNKGRFVTGSAVDQYFKQFDYSKRMRTLKDANKRTKLLKEQSKNFDRFSVNDFEFTKNLVDDYSHIYNGKKDQDKYFENTISKMSYDISEKSKNKFKFKEDGFIGKAINKFYKGLNIIDNFLFGEMNMEESVLNATDKFFRLKDTNLVKRGKIAIKTGFDKLMDNIFLPLLEGAAKIIKKGKTVISNIFGRAISILDEQIYPIVGEHLGKGFIPSMLNKVTSFFKEKFMQPIKDKFKVIEKHALEKFSKAVRNTTKWLNEEADKLRANKKVVNNFSNVLNTANRIATIEPENLAYYGFNSNNQNLYSPKSVNFNAIIPTEVDTIVTMPMKRYIKAASLAKTFIEKMNVDLAKFRRYHKAYTLVMTDAMIYQLKEAFTGTEWHGFDNNEEFRRELTVEDSRLLLEKVRTLTPNIILDIKSHKDEIYLWNITQKINSLVTDRTLGAVGLALGKYGLGGSIARGTKALAKWTAVKTATAGINTVRRIVGLAGHAAKVYHFVKTFKIRAGLKLLEIGTQYLLPALNNITKKFGPSIIHIAGSAGSKMINITGSIARKAFKALAKATEFTTNIAGSVITKITGGGLSLINKLFHRTGKLADGDARYIGHVIGGYLDYIEEPIQMQEVVSKIKYDDDEDEIKANEANAGKAENTILGRIGKRLSFINKFLNKIISKAVDSSLDFLTEGFTNVMSFILGGTVGTFIAEQGGKASQDAEDFGYERIFITGGSVNGGVVGDIINGVADGATDIDVSSTKKKGIVKKLTSFASDHKKGIGITVAIGATLAAGFSIFKKNKKEEETQEILNQPVENVPDESTQTEEPQNETVITPVSQVKGVSTTTPSNSNIVYSEPDPEPVEKTDNTVDNKFNVNLHYKDTAGKVIRTMSYLTPGPVGTVARIMGNTLLAKETMQSNNIQNKNVQNENRVQTEIEINNVINPYGTNTMSINTQLSEPKKNLVNISDMVGRYRKYIIDDTAAERDLYNQLSKRERMLYNAQKGISAFTNPSLFSMAAIAGIKRKNGLLATIGSFLLNIGKGIVGVIKSGFKLLKSIASTTIGVFKNVASFVKKSLGTVFGGILQIGKNVFGAVTDFVKDKVNGVLNLFGIRINGGGSGDGHGGGWLSNLFGGGSSGSNGGGGSGGGGSSVGNIPSNISVSGFAWPVPESSKISSKFGPRNISVPGASKDHKGIDISGGGKQDSSGYKIVASKAGKVTYAGPGRGYGNYIVIDHGGGYTTRYAHMHKNYMFVKQGDTVTQGQHIANIGNQGVSGGPHLHFEVRVNGTAYDPSGFVSYGSGNADRTLGKNEDGTKLTIPAEMGNIRKEHKGMPEVIDPLYEKEQAKNFNKNASKLLYKPKQSELKEDNTSESTIASKSNEISKNTSSPITNISVDENIESTKNKPIEAPSIKSNNVVDMDEYRQQKIINAKRVVTNNVKVNNKRDDTTKYNEIATLLIKLNDLMEEYASKDKKITILTEKVNSHATSGNIVSENDDFKEEMRRIDSNVINILKGI